MRDVAEAQDALARCLARLEHWGEATAAAERHARESPGEVAIAMLRRDIEDATAGKMTADEVANRAEARFYAALVDARLRARSSKPEARLASARLVCFCTDTGLLAEERSAAEDLLRRAYELDRYSSMAAFFDACVHFDAASSAQAIANQIAEVEAGLSVLARQRRVDAKHQDLKALEMTWTRAHQDLVERRWRGSVPKG